MIHTEPSRCLRCAASTGSALAFPGGKIEPDETPAEAAVREVAEEAGLEIRQGGEIGRRTHPATGRITICHS
jgi:8-oxo-dGTP pyrophosphatase MutT (NUDIX family)